MFRGNDKKGEDEKGEKEENEEVKRDREDEREDDDRGRAGLIIDPSQPCPPLTCTKVPLASASVHLWRKSVIQEQSGESSVFTNHTAV